MINVRFDKNGFHHVSVGRLGKGERHHGMIYALPDAFAAPGMLPKTAEIIEPGDELDDMLEDLGRRRPMKVDILDEEALESLMAAHKAKPSAEPQDAAQTPTRRRRRAAA